MTIFPETNGGWVKYPAPVMGDKDLGTCFDVHVLKDEKGYAMHFSWRPTGALAVAHSTDGIHWSEPEITLAPNPESGWEDRLNRDCVLYKDGLYRMWYTGQSSHYSWIGYAVSTDGTHFKRVTDQPVLFPERPFEGESVMNPFVLWDEDIGLYRMWYAAGEAYEPNVLAYATSIDGINWKKWPSNPVFRPDENKVYEQNRVGACQIIKENGWHYIFYIGYEDIDTARICVARSKNGISNWERLPANPIVSPTLGGWDESACYKPYVLWDGENDRWMLWYNGRKAGAYEYIGLVTHEGRDLGFDK